MDATVNLLDNEFGYSDKESDASSSYSTQVSSTVSDVLIGLNIVSDIWNRHGGGEIESFFIQRKVQLKQ